MFAASEAILRYASLQKRAGCGKVDFSQIACLQQARLYMGMRACENVRDAENLVGLSGLEPPTSRLSGVRSNLLSYRPIWRKPDGLLLFALECALSADLLRKSEASPRPTILSGANCTLKNEQCVLQFLSTFKSKLCIITSVICRSP